MVDCRLFCQSTGTYPYRREYHYRQFVTILLMRVKISLLLRYTQHIPARLIWQVDIQDDEIKIFRTEILERTLSIMCHAYYMIACAQVSSNDVTENIVIFYQENLCSRHNI